MATDSGAVPEPGRPRRTTRAPRLRVLTTPGGPLAAYVLHSYAWSETSLIVELLTRERGRVVVAAKGAKRPGSQLRPVLLPFQRLNVLLGRTPADAAAEVHVLRSAEWAGGVPAVAGAALYAGFYCNELLLKLLARQDAHPRLFDAYAATLPALAGDEAPALRAFELLLLRETGVLPDLAQETPTLLPLLPDRGYALHAEGGLVTAHAADEQALPGRAWLALEAALSHGHPEAVRAACAPVAAVLRGPLRALLHYHLGHSRLRTRQVLAGMQKLAPAPQRVPS